MVWILLLVFICCFLVDVFPFPLPPAFVVMIFLQIEFNINVWLVLVLGVAGSVLGRYVLMLYIRKLSGKIFSAAKNEDVEYLGSRLQQKGWKGQLLILAYCFMPLPSTPFFIAGGMSKVSPVYIITPFIVGKFFSDMILVLTGDYAAKNTVRLVEGVVSWQSITALFVGLLMVFILLFIDWRNLLQNKKFRLKFDIWK